MYPLSFGNSFPTAFVCDTVLQQSLNDELSFCQFDNMVFHWADFHETCESIKQHIEINSKMMNDFRRKEASLERLHLVPVWIKTNNKVHQMTMYELYAQYILNESHLIKGIDPFGPLALSFISGTGPFKAMSIAESFSKITYHDFILVYLLKDMLPCRDFRIKIKAKVLVEHGQDFGQAKLINLEQLTTQGLLFSVESDFFVNKLSKGRDFRVLLESSVLRAGIGKQLGELRAHLSQHTFNLMYSSSQEDAVTCSLASFKIQSSFDFFKCQKIYLFISYKTLASHGGNDCAQNFKDFVEYAKGLVSKHYKEIFQRVKSA